MDNGEGLNSLKKKRHYPNNTESLLFSDSKSFRATPRGGPNESLGALLDKVTSSPMPKPTAQPFVHQQQSESLDWVLRRLREHEDNERRLAVELEKTRVENRSLKQSVAVASREKSELEVEVLRLKELVAQMSCRQQSGQRSDKQRGVEADAEVSELRNKVRELEVDKKVLREIIREMVLEEKDKSRNATPEATREHARTFTHQAQTDKPRDAKQHRSLLPSKSPSSTSHAVVDKENRPQNGKSRDSSPMNGLQSWHKRDGVVKKPSFAKVIDLNSSYVVH